MGVKKIARPLNKAKNQFVKWLKDNNATDINEYDGAEVNTAWDYYRNISAFINNSFYTVYFTMFQGEANISYADESNYYPKLTIEEFLDLIDQ